MRRERSGCFLERGRTGEELACRRGDWGVSRCPGWERALVIGERGRGVSGWCMQLATWLERTRRNTLGGRGRRNKSALWHGARDDGLHGTSPYPTTGWLAGWWAGPGWCWLGVQTEIGAHDLTATTTTTSSLIDSCRSSSIFSHHRAHDGDCPGPGSEGLTSRMNTSLHD